MTNDEMTFEAHKQIVKPLTHRCDHIWRASVRSEKSARVSVRCGVVCTSPVAFMTVATFSKRNSQKEQKHMRRAQDYKWSPDSGELDNK